MLAVVPARELSLSSPSSPAGHVRKAVWNATNFIRRPTQYNFGLMTFKRKRSISPQDRSDDSVTLRPLPCERCVELRIPEILSAWSNKQPFPDSSNLVVQRFLFDGSLDPKCATCSQLFDQAGFPLLSASKIFRLDSKRSENEEFEASNSFKIHNSTLRRVTDHSYYNKFVDGGFTLSGQHHWMHEYFDRAPYVRVVNRTVDYDRLRTWLDHCVYKHESCRPLISASLDLIQLFDVETRTLAPFSSIPDTDRDFVALSYVWGGVEQRNQDNNIVAGQLPNTIEDCALVVKALGKRYLWVDSICIDQANEANKRKHIDIMDQIYEGAFATIIALDGKNANSGLPGVSDCYERTRQLIVRFAQNELIDRLPCLSKQVAVSPWAQRAWTYQESSLSRRRLIFSRHQVYFVCNRGDFKESSSDFALPSVSVHTTMRLPILRKGSRRIFLTYVEMVNEYVGRSLTNDSDALNVIAALLKHLVTKGFPEGFVYGLPLGQFRKSLLWHQALTHEVFPRGLPGCLNKTRRRRVKSIPSWSWAAWELGRNHVAFGCDKVSNLNLPLRVSMRSGLVIIGPGSPLSQQPDEAQHIPSEKAAQVEDAIHVTQNFYDRMAGSGVIDRAHQLNFSDLRPFHLQVEGTLLNLPCAIKEYFGSRLQVKKGTFLARIVLPDEMGKWDEEININPIDVMWSNDGYISDVAPSAAEVVDLLDVDDDDDDDGRERNAETVASASASAGSGLPRERPRARTSPFHPAPNRSMARRVRRQDLLLVSVNVGKQRQQLGLMHIYWRQNGVAERGGFVKISMEFGHAERFWAWVEKDARVCRFWLG